MERTNASKKIDSMKLLAIGLVVVSCIMLLLPWLSISVKVRGTEYSLSEILNMGAAYSGTSMMEMEGEITESLMDASEEAAEMGIVLDVQYLLKVFHKIIDGGFSPVDIAVMMSKLSSLMKTASNFAMSMGGANSASMMAITQASSTLSGVAIGLWAMVGLTAAAAVLAVITLLKGKKFGVIIFAVLAVICFATFALVVGSVNDALAVSMAGALYELAEPLEDLGMVSSYADISTDLLKLNFPAILCMLLAVAAVVASFIKLREKAPAYAHVRYPGWTCACGHSNDAYSGFCVACGRPAPQNGYAAPAPQYGYAPQNTYAPPAPQNTYAPPAPQNTYAPPAPQYTYPPAQNNAPAQPVEREEY